MACAAAASTAYAARAAARLARVAVRRMRGASTATCASSVIGTRAPNVDSIRATATTWPSSPPPSAPRIYTSTLTARSAQHAAARPSMATTQSTRSFSSVISQFVGEKGNAAVQVVTRNAHVDDIKTFLARSGLGDVGVTRIARPRSKAEVVAAKGGEEGEVALFVDDTIGEHLDEEMRAAVGVVRFLFVVVIVID